MNSPCDKKLRDISRQTRYSGSRNVNDDDDGGGDSYNGGDSSSGDEKNDIDD